MISFFSHKMCASPVISILSFFFAIATAQKKQKKSDFEGDKDSAYFKKVQIEKIGEKRVKNKKKREEKEGRETRRKLHAFQKLQRVCSIFAMLFKCCFFM